MQVGQIWGYDNTCVEIMSYSHFHHFFKVRYVSEFYNQKEVLINGTNLKIMYASNLESYKRKYPEEFIWNVIYTL